MEDGSPSQRARAGEVQASTPLEEFLARGPEERLFFSDSEDSGYSESDRSESSPPPEGKGKGVAHRRQRKRRHRRGWRGAASDASAPAT